MSLVQCPDCKMAVSNRATNCPGCGAKLRNKPNELFGIGRFGWLMIILLAIMVYTCSNKKDASEYTSKQYDNSDMGQAERFVSSLPRGSKSSITKNNDGSVDVTYSVTGKDGRTASGTMRLKDGKVTGLK